MKRVIVQWLGLLFIVIGCISVWFLQFRYIVIGLIVLYLGFFLRLIYNSEKYKFYKYVNSKLISAGCHSYFQRSVNRNRIFGLSRASVDLIAVFLLPFLIINLLNLPWYIDSLIAVIYVISLRPIFKDIDSVDRRIADDIVEQYVNFKEII